jgi:monovalent cation/hydrogen antiporter
LILAAALNVMKNFEIIILVFAILLALLALCDRLKLPSAILLVAVGLTLGLIPSMPSFILDPDVVFLLFLPPVLYDAASHTSWRDFKSEIRPISTLAVALVFFTTMSVAIAAYYLIPGFTWPMAFVLGAIISPPDAVAATGITKGLGLNKRVVTILQGESLVNDASALIAYRFAIAAMSTGAFLLWEAGLNFIILVAGGISAGVLIGYLFIVIHKRILNNSIISTSLTILTPFVSYLAAELVHTSGVLAVVSTGLMISWRAPEIFSYHTRIRNRAVWDTAIFLLNGFIFILIGLQLPLIFQDLGAYSKMELISYGLLISGVTILVRILWVFSGAYSPLGKKLDSNPESPYGDDWKNVLIVAWTGTRGVVSLATALALPLTLLDGSAFPQRSLILFLSFVVIFMTLVVQGLSLPLLIRLLGVSAHPDHDAVDKERELRLLLANSALNFIDTELQGSLSEHAKIAIRKPHIETISSLAKILRVHEEEPVQKGGKSIEDRQLAAQQEILTFQRRILIDFHKEGSYDQSILRRIEQELDHAELLTDKLIRKAM